MRTIVELVMRLPGGAFWGAVVLAPLFGLTLLGVAIPVFTKRRALGAGILALALVCFGSSVFLVGCLVVDLTCTGRAGTWIC